jgi:PAS domain S-box-containing protein
MPESLAAPSAPPRTLAADMAWTTSSAFGLAMFARLFETPAEGDATVWWASGALSAILATAPRERWRPLGLAFALALLAALLLERHGVAMALARTVAWTAEGMAGGWLASAWLRGSRGAAAPLGFVGLLIVAALLPQILGATIAAAFGKLLPLAWPSVPPPPHGAGVEWLATWSGDSFGALGLFPLALALRRAPPTWPSAREATSTSLLVVLVVSVTMLSFATLPHPVAFCSLVLCAAALVAGLRTMFLLVWACMVSATCALSQVDAPAGGLSLRWQQLNVFLPVMAVSAPIQVLAIALRRIHQANAVLRQSRERFRELYERAPVMLQSLDGQGRTTEVNAQWLATLGHGEADDVRGLPFERFVHDSDPARADPDWHRRLLAGGTKLHVCLRTHDGRPVHALASAATAPDDVRGRRGMVLALEDVSVEIAMREEIERERAQLAAITSATSDLAIFLDRELRYASVNRAFERYWNVARGDVLGRAPSEVPGQDFFAREIAAPLARALEGEASNLQVAIDFPLGRRVMEVALAPAFDAAGAQAGVVATLHDVTELVHASRELQSLVEDLRHANEGLEQFARIAAHDLREPLNTISQFASLIEHDHRAALPAEAARYFGLMGRAALRMKAMLDDVLRYARLERMPPPQLEVVALDQIFAELRELLHARLAQTHATLEVPDALPPVLGQASLLELMFQNVLLNATRYSKPGVEPRIVVTAERTGSLVVVTVADNGVGIPPTELERVFQPFHRLQGRQDEDSGLGLAICRRIAAALGGRVWADTEGGRGTRLHVALQAVS